VTHYSRLYTIVIDAPAGQHDQELAFWQGAIGQSMEPAAKYSEYHGVESRGEEFVLLLQRLDDGAARVHLDIHTDDLAAEVARLEGLGAERVRQVHDWWVMRDPAGLPFCVVPDPPGTLNDGNAQRWD
jgi:hypothetical protein